MMFFTTPDPVLIVQESQIQGIDPKNPASLFGMWSVFSKASGMMEHGKRFENLSWRLWMQQRLCEKQTRQRRASASTPSSSSTRKTHPIPHNHNTHESDQEPPALSSSVDSVDSDISIHSGMTSSDRTLHDDNSPSSTSSLGREKELTPLDLKNLVKNIKDNTALEPLSPLPPSNASRNTRKRSPKTARRTPTPRPSSPRPVQLESSSSTILSASTDATQISPTSTSDTSEDSAGSSHSIVRGFAPGRGVSIYRTQSQQAPSPVLTPILKSSASHCKPASIKKKVGLFEIGSGSSEGSGTLQEHMSPGSFRSKDGRQPSSSSAGRKTTSFKEEVTEIQPPKRTPFFIDDDDRDDGAAIESDSEDEEEEVSSGDISESAIEDDEDAWEDEGEADEGPGELVFRRIDSKPDLVSRRSLLTLNLAGNPATQQGSGLKPSQSTPLLRRSRTSSPNGPSMPGSPDRDSTLEHKVGQPLGQPQRQPGNTRAAVPFAITPQGHNPIMSPRDTRRTMLTQELGVSLRKHMLNERQQRNFFSANSAAAAAAALPRRAQTSVDMRQLATQAEQPKNVPVRNNGALSPINASTTNSWTEYEKGTFNNCGW